jgi:adenylate kinase family enzyme
MTRISVVGCSGAGKTTVATKLAHALGVPHIELDALHWGPDWGVATTEEMMDRVGGAISGDEWVVDGNYHGKIGALVWERADAIVWVDPPRWRVMFQVLRRTVIRAVAGKELWNGNRESLAGLMFWRGG